jgi:8-oxo-dGTP pyrophosphatase MutT (NUDIX family)
MAFEIEDSQTKFRGRVFDVRQDQVRMPDGRLARFDVVAHHGTVTILPLDEEGQVWFVRQYRHPAQAVLLELPAGVMDEGELPEESARREIREEIGMAAGELREIGTFFLAPGYSTEFMHVFLATHLTPAPLAGDEDEFITIEKIPLRQVFQTDMAGNFRDSKTLAALYLAQPYLV